MKKIPKQAYTIEFKELPVKRVNDGASVSVVVKELGIGDQTLCNWIKAAAEAVGLFVFGIALPLLVEVLKLVVGFAKLS